ncbi:MAG: hypothetical protein WDN04_04305 [Rhodospirillales bacterium]
MPRRAAASREQSHVIQIIQSHERDRPVVAERCVGRQKIVKFTGSSDIQTGLIKEFPVGTFAPANGFPVTFSIPKANTKKSPPKYNFWDDPTGQPLTVNVSVPKAKAVYTLMNAYSPAIGSTIATVEFKGSKGADQTFSLVAGTDIRDFCQNFFANTINGTTTQTAFAVSNVQDACGTGNVHTGLISDYRVDEQQFTLSAAFAKQKLTQIIITPTGAGGSRPIVLGISVATGGKAN